jgi:ribosome-binding factor A
VQLSMAKSRRQPREGSARDSGLRGQRLEELFREELNSILDSEINDPRLDGVHVTSVELTRDGARARVWFHSRDAGNSATDTTRALERAASFLRARLCDALPVKRFPELRFAADPGFYDSEH